MLNRAVGGNHDGSPNAAGVPAIYGLNFQAVSTAQKLNLSHYATDGGTKGLGGYTNGGVVPGPVVAGALDFIDASLKQIIGAIDATNTVLVVSAKHGQSPVDRAQLTLIDDGEVTGALNTAWAKSHPADPQLVQFSISDDAMLLWLADRSEHATEFARTFRWNYQVLKASGSDANGKLIDKTADTLHSGLRAIYAGADAAELIGVRRADERVPDVIGIAAVGTVYSSPAKIKKISEHGGSAAQDRHVPIIVWGAGVKGRFVDEPVETTQIAPTILSLLGLRAEELQAVRKEDTEVLPKFW